MGMILRIASSRIVGQGDIVGRSGYFSLNLSANSVMRGRLDARRTLKSLVADLRLIYDFLVLRSLILCGFSTRSKASMVCTHVIPRLRIAALWPTWVFGKRPFFLKRIFMAKNAILMATIIRVNNSVFNIFAYICATKLRK